jgi:signal transduction histidine kinase
MNAGDEIGDLARSVSNMLEKLKQHNGFLENMPRTLRHEINNPLNTLSTSLQNLARNTQISTTASTWKVPSAVLIGSVPSFRIWLMRPT